LLLWIPLRQKPGIGTLSNVIVIGWWPTRPFGSSLPGGMASISSPRRRDPPQWSSDRGLYRRRPRAGASRRADDGSRRKNELARRPCTNRHRGGRAGDRLVSGRSRWNRNASVCASHRPDRSTIAASPRHHPRRVPGYAP
jgi:hypothetical protein